MSEPQSVDAGANRSAETRWLPEWEPHLATWLSWPHNGDTWPNNLTAAQDEFEQMIRLLAERETVRLLVGEEVVAQIKQRNLDQVAGVEVWPIPTNDAWVRDYGPTVVHSNDGQRCAFVDWQYNAWGNKYPPFDRDQQVARLAAEQAGCECRSVSYVLEGGAIEGNGAGQLMTTDSCLFEANRNPSATRSDYEELFQNYLGISQVIWLPGGDIEGDDTDGHIDQIARFLGTHQVLVADASDAADPNRATFLKNQQALQDFIDASNEPWELHRLECPADVSMFGVRLPASYANFIWTNGAIIVPQFQTPEDERALGLFRELLPGRDIIPASCRELLVGLGAWHCLSQQHCQLV